MPDASSVSQAPSLKTEPFRDAVLSARAFQRRAMKRAESLWRRFVRTRGGDYSPPHRRTMGISLLRLSTHEMHAGEKRAETF